MNTNRKLTLKKSTEDLRIETAIHWYNIGVGDGRKWEAAARNDDPVIEIDGEGNIKHKHKLNILRDPEGEYALMTI